MRYNGKDMLLREYYETRMAERNLGDSKTEVEWNIIADYYSSCDFNLNEIDFIESLGYTVEDFAGRKEYEVVISASTIRRVLLQTESYREALEMYEAYNNGNGEFVDMNGFVWDLYIDDWDQD